MCCQLALKRVALPLAFCLACVFITLWVTIGPGIHKNYETPTPVRNSPLFFPILSSVLTLLGSVLVLDQPSVPERTPWWRIHLDVDRTICFGNTIHSAGFLGGGFLVVVLPISITRWLLFTNHHVSLAATLFAISMFYLSGAINVLLFLIIRPELLLFPRPEELDE
jgi:hypothetical protein